MITCRCPHCQAQISDDGRLSGQIVACPACHQAFQMPLQARRVEPVPPPPPMPREPSNVPAITTSVAQRYRGRKEPAGASPKFYVVIGILLVISAGVTMFGNHLQTSARREYLEAGNVTWKERGYRLGYMCGESSMNVGGTYHPEHSFESIYYGIRKRIREGKEKQYKDLPELGSDAFGDLKRGFLAGYHAGFTGTK